MSYQQEIAGVYFLHAMYTSGGQSLITLLSIHHQDYVPNWWKIVSNYEIYSKKTSGLLFWATGYIVKISTGTIFTHFWPNLHAILNNW